MRIFSHLLIVGTFTSLVACSGEDSNTTAPRETKQPTKKPLVDTSSEQSNESTNETSSSVTTLGGIPFRVRVIGTIPIFAPNAALDVSIAQAGGTRPVAIRVWVGDESGVGSIKTKTHSHGSTYHAHATAPATIPANCAVWIEVQAANGNRSAGSVVLH